MNSNKNVLFITHMFPPVFGSGALRMKGFVSNLADFGWDCFVLTLKQSIFESHKKVFKTQNKVLVPVSRIFGLNSRKHLSIKGRYIGITAYPDSFVFWTIPAVLKGLSLIRKNKISKVFSSFPIPTCHLIAYILHKLTRVIWIADFRDPMIQEGYPKERLKSAVWKWIEKKTMKHAQKILFTTSTAKQYYLKRYPGIDSEKLKVVENGYNEEDFYGLEDITKQANKIRFVHAGTLYPYERNPLPLFKGVKYLLDAPDVNENDFVIEFFGAGDPNIIATYENAIEKLGIEKGCIKFNSSVPHQKMLKILNQSDILLIMQGSSCDYQIPAKIYEYFRICKPVLGLTSYKGDTGKLILENRAGMVCPMEDPSKIAEILGKIIKGSKILPKISTDRIKQFSRKAQAKNLISILDEI